MFAIFGVWATIGAPDSGAADRAAIARAAAGDSSAIAEIYDRHARLVYSLALRIVRNTAEAEDVVQEVFSQVWQQAARYDSRRANVAAWLVMLARSRAIDRLRAQRSRRQQGSPVTSELAIPDGALPADDQLMLAGRAALIRDAIDGLPVLQRVAIELAFYEGLTHQEIAERLEWPLGTVKTRIRQTLLRLRDALQGAVR